MKIKISVEIFFSTPKQFRLIEGIVMMSKEGSTKIVNFMTLRAVILVLGRGHISHIYGYI